jgi:hypothetical protein
MTHAKPALPEKKFAKSEHFRPRGSSEDQSLIKV